MGGCIGSPRDGTSPNGDSSDGTGVGQSGKIYCFFSVAWLTKILTGGH